MVRHRFFALSTSNSTRQADNPERLEPTARELNNALLAARSYWHGLTQHAVAQYEHGIPLQSLAPQKLLRRVPSIPDNRASHCHALLDASPSNEILYLRARATWRIPKGGDCGVCEKQKTRAASLPIGVQRPIPLRFGNDAFSSERSEKSKPYLRRNMIGLLVLRWLYIFSAEMV